MKRQLLIAIAHIVCTSQTARYWREFYSGLEDVCYKIATGNACCKATRNHYRADVCVSPVERAGTGIDFATIDVQTVQVADGLYVLMAGPPQGNIAVTRTPG